ncbi:uncharacterized protein LOC103573462 isoform X1 [Microplitis demolitor]|uniref:uncharacterized protein LOC103573462 isoform X1 n=1 Tax=Microplitis demolitor TaxID=69319 RepID=UPI0004CDB969|nr:uncharacterized protein LOC103573462 isoform X1 [Microplitis demolitor]
MNLRVIIFLNIATCVWTRPSNLNLNLQNNKNDNYLLKRVSRSLDGSEKNFPFSPKTLETMLEKAILKIITGDLSNGDLLLLRSLNYSLEEILAIRDREFKKNDDNYLGGRNNFREVFDENLEPTEKYNNFFKKNDDGDDDSIDIDAYNRQAVLDYENLANKMEEFERGNEDGGGGDIEKNVGENKTDDNDDHLAFARAMEPHVVFKIGYNETGNENNGSEKLEMSTSVNNLFHDLSTVLPGTAKPDGKLEENESVEGQRGREEKPGKKVSEYEGLEWVEDDVYRVIPEALNEQVDESEEERGDDASDDEFGFEGFDVRDQEVKGANDSWNYDNGNLSAYQQLALAHRRDGNQSSFDSQGQKAIEDIKLRVLAMTGRFNLTSTDNQVQRERLTMFTPSCEVPKNTDAEIWADPFSMNMYFQINLTSNDHVVAAKLRLYKLPQNMSLLSSTNSPSEEEDEEDKKIRISIYFYMRSLKKHRSKKKLMDSVVTPLTSEGSHLALDVRQALRYWRQVPRIHASGTNNHGLVVQVEDQEGRPLKPALYVQDSCHADDNTDNKAYQRVPALFFRACSRYVRVVNGEAVTYINCKHKSSRHRS